MNLVRSVRRSISVDWTARDDVRARLRTIIKRLLALHGYPPDAQADAIRLVLRQMETFTQEWAPDHGEIRISADLQSELRQI